MKESSSMQGEPSTSGAVDDSYPNTWVDDTQLSASVPALNQAASYLAQTASYLTQCLPVPSYVGLPQEGQELVTLPPPSAAGRPSVQTSSVELAGATASLDQVDCSGSPSQENSGQMVPSSVFQNGTSLFQGLVERARKTVRGSADDIGWLQRDPTLPTTEDGTARFLEILESVRKNEHKLPDSVVYLLVPGLFSNHGPLYFVKTKAYFSKMGLACHIARIHSEGDLQALEDLIYERRREFLRQHPLPKEVPIVSFHTEASITPSVLTALSHVAHLELPVAADGSSTRIPVVVPLSAAMAACSQLLVARYGEKSDGLVTRKDAEVPGSVVVRPERKLDHAWMVYSSLKEEPGDQADTSQVCEALLTLLVEVAQKRRHEMAMKDE